MPMLVNHTRRLYACGPGHAGSPTPDPDRHRVHHFQGHAALHRLLTALIVLCLTLPAAARADESQPGVPLPDTMMPVDEVRPGMQGYGLTVFRGTRIEPFTFEVISVEQTASAKRAVVWVRCPEPRMQQSGAVQGMSGSPMYVWGPDEPRVPGQGGRLLGAFAFGFGGAKDCFVGVQPIEYMMAAADRAAPVEQARAPGGSHSPSLLAAMQRHADQTRMPASDRWRLDALAEALGVEPGDAAQPTTVPGPMGEASAQPMLLPLTGVAGPVAEAIAPLLTSAGLTARAGPGTTTGDAPGWLDIEQTTIAPGSVLAIPLGFGDLKLAAVGTATHVKDDGTVLGFGHAMTGSGDTAMPVATGYVHMVLPSRNISFKLGAPGKIVGTLVRDENTAVVGKPGIGFETAPMTVAVNRPGQPAETFNYTVVRHPQFSPVVAVTVMLQSLLAQQALPTESTVHVQGELTFDGGRVLPIDAIAPRAAPQQLVFQLLPGIAAMAQNPHGVAQLTRGEITLTIENKVRNADLMQARLDRSQVEPGDEVNVVAKLSRHGQPPRRVSTAFTVPRDTRPGNYQVVVGDAETYGRLMMANRPHLSMTESIDDVLTVVKQVLAVRNNQLFAVMLLEPDGLAVGRNEMPSLPSSRLSLMTTPASTMATPYARWVESSIELDTAVSGQMMFQLTVNDPDAPTN